MNILIDIFQSYGSSNKADVLFLWFFFNLVGEEGSRGQSVNSEQ
jgi:hypothetical protein